MKRLERKLKERRERSESPSSNSSGYNDENYAYDRYYGVYTDEDTYDPVINLEEDIGDEERPRPTHAQLDTPPPPPPAPGPAPAPAPATTPPPPPPPPATQLPSTSLPVEAVPGTSSAVTLHDAQGADAEVSLDPAILDLLGEDPSTKKTYGASLHKDIAPRWAHILVNGLTKESQADLIKQYPPPENCTSLSSPKLNPEIKAALSELSVKQDQYSQGKQTQLGSGLAALGHALNWAVQSKDIIPPDIVKYLIDAGRLICDNHYRESLSRRYAVLNTLNKNIRDTVKDTKIDENLFGSNLSDHLKSSKAITKTGSEMKPPPRVPYRAPTAFQPRGALNSRGNPRAAAGEPRTAPAPRRPPPPPPPPPRERRQYQPATRGRQRSSGYSRHHRRH
ncbi:uncharacterized protein C6orf132-like [Leguminivora glycinivorella]|uniref:uncharacterized protein C6orf132-like n=1 Tax=Leguminivora glycinivorella TaxID=1035111 RepID=UPI0020102EA5|nr:uncharacterized protein C6orf132-like [Leguminivora glycinivorella]